MGWEHSRNKPATLCWDCANAVEPEICPWVGSGSPVPGWEAERTHIRSNTVMPDSYRVTSCPLFERDAVNKGRRYYVKGRDDE